VEEAIDNAVPMPVISASLFARFASRQPVSPALQAVAALRGQFGGHAVMTIADGEKLRATVAETAGAKASPGQVSRGAAKVAAKKNTARRAAAPKAGSAG
jgi:6-phosphogluconate dehydrogenase